MLTADNLEINMSFGANLKRLRRDKGWTQHQLANACDIKTSHIPRLEKEQTDPKLSTIYKLVAGLECTTDALLMDYEKIGINGRISETIKRANNLPEANKIAITDVIDKYCIAVGMEETFNKESGILPTIRIHTESNESVVKKDELEKIK